MRAWRIREPDEPYDGDPEEPTPKSTARRIEPCVPCRATGRIHVVHRNGRDAGRGRPCPICRGRGFRMLDVDGN
jgi:hypothetical protein